MLNMSHDSEDKDLCLEKEIQEVKRGFWLSSFLIAVMLFNPLIAISYITIYKELIDVMPQLTQLTAYALGFFGFANFILAIGMWNWKKWAVYGFYVSVICTFILNLMIGLGIANSIASLFSALIAYVLTKESWVKFK